jgi:light-regulated signal transduction histidine kinase (bacteriophytochrome)
LATDVGLEGSKSLTEIIKPQNTATALAVGATVALFIADIVMPRGATPAIGYALVLVLAGGSRSHSVVFGIAAACTVLTWAGFVLEPAGAARWMSAFDRSMVASVLWLAALLVSRRLSLITALAEGTRALERANNELSRSNAELDRFASVVAHDLRGPLNGISLITKLLSQSCRDILDPEKNDWLASVQSEINGMSQLIERLLAYGRIGCGAVRLSSCDCEGVLSAVTRSLAADLKSADATVTHDPLPIVRADPVLISELMQNLIENAVKYRGEEPPHVHISAVHNADEVVVTVQDNGIGIPEADRDTVFRAFTQLKEARGGTGVGLGLATCKRIVQRHGGRIWVEAVSDRGSAFKFALPMVTPEARG